MRDIDHDVFETRPPELPDEMDDERPAAYGQQWFGYRISERTHAHAAPCSENHGLHVSMRSTTA
jgi:hypothetical protein